MLMVLLMLLPFAVASAPVTLEYPPVDFAGATLKWTTDDCNLSLLVTNEGPEPLVIDWMQSTITEGTGLTVGVVPGSTSKVASMMMMPPLVVPVGASAAELIFRKDRVSDAGSCTIVGVSQVSVMLRVNDAWVTQPIAVKADEARASAIEAARLQAAVAAAAAQAKAQRCADLGRRRSAQQGLVWWLGVPLAGVGLLTLAGGAGEGGADGAGLMTLGGIMVAGGAVVIPMQAVKAADTGNTMALNGCPR